MLNVERPKCPLKKTVAKIMVARGEIVSRFIAEKRRITPVEN